MGRYDLVIEAQGFQQQKKTDIGVDTDAAVRVDSVLQVAAQSEEVTVTAAGATITTQVETTATHLGEVVGSMQIEAIPLNGRAYTDLLAIQPGVAPVTTLTPTSVIIGGRHWNHQSFRRPEPGRRVHRRPARIIQRLHGIEVRQQRFSRRRLRVFAEHLKYIPLPTVGTNLFSTSVYPETVRDDKGSGRIDANTFLGVLSGYYFMDDYRLDNPYPRGQGGASIPGFDALTIGRAQMFTIGDTKVLGPTLVNELHGGFLRNMNNIGAPHSGLGVPLASQGFSTNQAAGGIPVQAPQFEGVENIVFPSFVMGVLITNLDQRNNTLYLSDSMSKVTGTHTIKFGGQFHVDQVNETRTRPRHV